jgi:hypothetical protein
MVRAKLAITKRKRLYPNIFLVVVVATLARFVYDVFQLKSVFGTNARIFIHDSGLGALYLDLMMQNSFDFNFRTSMKRNEICFLILNLFCKIDTQCM